MEFLIERIGDRPAGRLSDDSRLLEALHAVDRHLGIRTEQRVASTDANIPLSLGIPALSIGAEEMGEGSIRAANGTTPAAGSWRSSDSAAAPAGIGSRRPRPRQPEAVIALGLCCLMAALFSATTQSPVVAIYYHGNILTGVGLGGSNVQRVTAIAVGSHEIVAIGDDAAVLRQKQPGTRLFDLHGAFVMPGFNDAHVHLANAGRIKLAVDLTGSASLAEMLRRVSAAAAAAPAGEWLLGGGRDHTLWATKTLPTRQDLDSVSGGHPAIFTRVDGHIAVANSAALALSGVTNQTPSPQGGQLDHDADGN